MRVDSDYRPPIQDQLMTVRAKDALVRPMQKRMVVDAPLRHTPERKVRAPLSFNLSHDRDRAREALQSGDDARQKLARDGFINNARYWAKEYIGDIKTTHYYWEITEDQGRTRLYHPSFGFADDSSLDALNQPNLPKYERKRRKIEDDVTNRFSSILRTAKKGETYIWASPPPEDEQDEKRDGDQVSPYGGYTMTHIYEVDEIGGKRILKGRDVKNRLVNQCHKEVLEELAGENILGDNPSSLDILNIVVKPQFGVSSRDVEKKIREKEKEMGIGDSGTDEQREQVFEAVLTEFEWKLEKLFQMLQMPDMSEAFIANYFQAWIKDIQKGTVKDSKQAASMSVGGGSGGFVGGGSCGEGVGFGGNGSDGSSSGVASAFGYEPSTMSANLSGTERKLKCKKCPFCPAKDIEATIKNGRIYCPSCRKSAEYKC